MTGICPPVSNGKQCTAKDFTFEGSTIVRAPDSCESGSFIPLIEIRVGMESTSTERYDIAFFIGTHGESALGGSACDLSSFVPLEPVYNGESGVGPYRNLDDNMCGDALKTDGIFYHNIVMTDVLCIDEDEDGLLDASALITWKNNTAECDNPLDPQNFIGEPFNKCIYRSGDIPVDVVEPPIDPEPPVEPEPPIDPEQPVEPGIPGIPLVPGIPPHTDTSISIPIFSGGGILILVSLLFVISFRRLSVDK